MPTTLFKSHRLLCGFVVFLTLFLSVPASAAGKSVGGMSVTLVAPELDSFSRADCSATSGTEVAFRWSMGGALIDGDSIALFVASDESCSSTTLSLRPSASLSVSTGSFPLETDITVKALDLFNAVSFGSGGCSDPGVRQNVFFCAAITNPNVSSGGFSSARAYGSAPLLLNSKLPIAPVNLGLTPLEGGALVTWSRSPAETEEIVAFNVVATPPTGTPVRLTTPSAQNLSATVSGLENGVTYLISVTAVDGAGRTGNEGPPVIGTVTPVVSHDFLQLYKEKGGDETGGCTSTLPSMGALVLMVLFLWRRRRTAIAAALAVGCLMAPEARADTRKSCENPCLSLQVESAPYRPAIDSEKGLSGTPYATTFGNSSPWLSRLTLGVAVRTDAGTFGINAAAGYWLAQGKAHSQDARNVATGDDVTLSLTTVTPMLAWRGQFLFDRWHFPLVPFLQAGYGFVSWRTEKNGKLSTADGAKGEGWARGVEGAGGLILMLDAFDPDGSAAFLRNYGLSSTGLVVSYSMTTWRGTKGMVLGDGGFTVGLIFLH